jgi:hypothetical protein
VTWCGGEANAEQRMQNRARRGTARLEAGEQHREEEAGGSARRRGGGRFWEMRLGTGICKVALGFPGTGAGGWDPSAFAPLATRQH